MFRMYGKVMLAAGMLLLLFLLAACGPTDNPVGNSNVLTTSIKAITPTVVKARSVRGSPGNGPIVVTSSTPVPDGNANSQQVVLNDRTLVLNNVSKQNAAEGHSSLVSLVLTVKNTSDGPIMNQSTFFQLMGAEGDTFTYQSNSSGNFYGNVPAHSSHDGTIVFQVPVAAAFNLRLFYRPEVATETVLISLKV